jgi:hypothetical protein
MRLILSVEEIQSGDRHRVGGKGYALSRLVKHGFRIPKTVCITSDAYQEYVLQTGLRERIMLELHRKDFKQMRWEEIWDCATRIRNMFLIKSFPHNLGKEIRTGISDRSRPITNLRSEKPEDERGWYMSLHRSFDNLKNLRRKIEDELIPGMIAVAESLSAKDLVELSDQALIAEIRQRWEINNKWVNIYWADFIPYAHGVRMFGQVYNDAVQPEDPSLLSKNGFLDE